MNTLFRSAGFVLGIVLGLSARAEVTLASPFTDHAVLQCDKLVPVWGWADPGEKITVTFAGQTAFATAADDRRWLVYLQPLPVSSESRDLVVTGENTLTLRDVLVGEVWLCSGQSNMEFPVYDPNSRLFHLQNAAEEVAAAKFPLIRQFLVARTVAESPAETVKGEWAVCSPEAVGKFTAVGYCFARDLHQRLDVPVGIINSSWGGTPIESWLSPAALAGDPAFEVVGERWRQMLADYPVKKPIFDAEFAAWQKEEIAAKAAGAKAHADYLKQHRKPRAPRGPGDAWTPAGLFNGMINPLLPYALRGALWYQGESNAERAGEYHALFSAMIAAWRAHFGQDDFPFYWVQLANYKLPSDPTGATYAFLREAQTKTLVLPHTGQAVIIDVGDPDDIHPGNKQDVGRRLALLAKNRIYGITGDDTGPTFVSATREGAALRVRFTYASGGLIAHDKPVQSLEIAGADQRFFPATAKIERDMLLVSAPEVKAPVAVRYAWSNAPTANLFSGAGLPAVPFRSDNW